MIEFQGLENIEQKLEKLADVNNIKQSLEKACALVEGEAKKKAPKGNGELRRSITSKVETEGSDIKGIVFTPLEYAPYVEYGTGLFAENGGRTDVPWSYQDEKGEWHSTSGMKPQPYLRPALDESREKIIQILQEDLLK